VNTAKNRRLIPNPIAGFLIEADKKKEKSLFRPPDRKELQHQGKRKYATRAGRRESRRRGLRIGVIFMRRIQGEASAMQQSPISIWPVRKLIWHLKFWNPLVPSHLHKAGMNLASASLLSTTIGACNVSKHTASASGKATRFAL
jgi:hypothetical protein